MVAKTLLKYYKDEFDTVGNFLLACGIGSWASGYSQATFTEVSMNRCFFKIIEGGFGIQFSAKLTGNFFLRAGISAGKRNFHEGHQNFSFLFGKKKCERQLCKRNWSKNNIESAKPKKNWHKVFHF